MIRKRVLAATLCLALAAGCAHSFSREDVLNRAGSADFADLQSFVSSRSFTNITVLPDAAFLVVDGLVINPAKRTYGEAPAGAMYETYYERGSSSSFQSLPALLKARNIGITEEELSEIAHRMESLGVGDILKKRETGLIIYSWNMSGIWGANGVMFAPSEPLPADVKKDFNVVEPIRAHFYYWAAGG